MRQSPIKPDESVVFFPTYATRDDSAAVWNAKVHGWIFEPSLLGGISLAALKLSLDLPPDPVTDELFRNRAMPFVVDNERGKAIPIAFQLDAQSEVVVLAESTPNGHFHDQVRIPQDHIPSTISPLGETSKAADISFSAITRDNDDRNFAGSVQLIGNSGLSVISDIDDTIRVSNVSDHKELLRNTFLRPYQAVTGMPERYAKWQATAPQPLPFHYVTAAPWQLCRPLSSFIRDEKFPTGTMHMKLFRMKDSTVFNLFRDHTQHKMSTIGDIFRDFPQRRFVLVGDAGEQDPEVYAGLARNHADQVAAIYIRDLKGVTRSAERFQTAFKDVPASLWHLFADGDDLPDSLTDLDAGG